MTSVFGVHDCEGHSYLVNIQPDGTYHQFLLSQNQVECTEFGTHYTYVLDDGFLLPGTHVGGIVHNSDGNPISDGHHYQENRGLWFTDICGVQPPGPNGSDLMVVPNGSGGILVTSETNDAKYTLVHEILLHAYAAESDDQVFGTAFLLSKGLWRQPGTTATTGITGWMSADCRCTPGNPATPSCKANSAKW